jgi:drug/metabolite transporter (DMT)-like permease
VALAAFVCLGATCTFALASVVRGGPELGFGAAGWAWVGAIALVSTVAAILCFFAGLARVGPSAASILSTLEPLVTSGWRRRHSASRSARCSWSGVHWYSGPCW